MTPLPSPPSSPARAPRVSLLLAGLLSLWVGPLACLEARPHPTDVTEQTPSTADAGPEPLPLPPRDANAWPEEPRAGTVRIGAYNVHRLFDTYCETGICGGSAYEEQPSAEILDVKATRLADAIRSLKAGVVLVEEVETQASLDVLLAKLPEFPHALLGEMDVPASVDVGVLSRHPILFSRRYRDSTPLTRPDGSSTTFAREFLAVHLDVAGTEVIVFPAHFRSKNNDDPGRRLAEARAARDILGKVAAQYPRALVVLGGDLNDTPGSEPLTALEQDGALLRVASDRPASEWGTYNFGGTWQALDHLFFARGGSGQYVPGSFRSVREGSRGLGGSDHAAVVADFELPR